MLFPTTIYVELIFTKRKFSPISPSALIDEIFIMNFLSRVNDYIEDMATFTALAKIYSTKINILQYKGSWAWQNNFL